MKFHLTIRSANRKTGPMPVSTSPKSTCPTSCPFRKNGCYAEGGPLAIHWREVSCGRRGDNWSSFVSKIKELPNDTIWRCNQSGDLRGSKNQINKAALSELVAANKGKQGYTYTHYSMLGSSQAKHNREAVKAANKNGFTINLSVESLEQADKLMDLKAGPVVITLPSDAKNTVTPKGRKVVICPATMNDKMTCSKCKLCAQKDRKFIIGFKSHGYRKNCVDKMWKENVLKELQKKGGKK